MTPVRMMRMRRWRNHLHWIGAQQMNPAAAARLGLPKIVN